MKLAEIIVLFIVGLALLIKGGDWFVDGATDIARKFHIPEILIGATIVSIGTTLPEVMVSVTGAINGQGSMAYGNAIGSIICNSALICAVTIAVKPCEVDRKSYFIPVIFFFASCLIYSIVAICTGTFNRWVGILLFAIFVGYMIFQIILAKKNPIEDNNTNENKEEAITENPEEEKEVNILKSLLLLLLGAACIAVGANFLVHYGTLLAEAMGVPEKVIAITFVALGTSLPELITAITSLIKGHSSLSLGNIVGANLFNLVLVSGLSIAVAPFDVPAVSTIAGINSSFIVDIPVMFIVMALLTIPTLIKKKVSRYQGIALLVIYLAFCIFQFVY